MQPTTTFRPEDRVLPLFFPGALVHYMCRRGHDPKSLLRGTGLDDAALEKPETRVSFHTVRRIIRNSEKIWRRSDLGLHFGSSLNVTTLGMIGQAAYASNTLGEAMETIARYLSLRDPLLHYQVESRKDSTLFLLNSTVDLGDVEEFITQAAFAASYRFTKQLTGLQCPAIRFAWRTPAPPQGYESFLGPNAAFSTTGNSFSIPGDVLGCSLETASPISASEARQYCEAEMAQFEENMGFAMVVSRLIQSRLGNIPTEETAAEILGHSGRNLRRRLASEHMTYRGLVEGIREENAVRLLRNSHQRIEEIAYQLGYRNAGNFCRAFKRWTGHSPSAFRRNETAI